MIIINADGLQDGLYNVKDGQIFKYKANGGTVRTYEMGEVVRCKDCKHRDPEDKKCDCGMWHFPYITDDNDYCPYGERRES